MKRILYVCFFMFILFFILIGIMIYTTSHKKDKNRQKTDSVEYYSTDNSSTSINVLYSDMNGDIDYDPIIPSGTILMWNGVMPPSGWVLCDGKNDTPDLRGRFVLGTKKDMSDIESEDMSGGNSLYLTQEMISHNHDVITDFDITKLKPLIENTHHHDYVTVHIFPEASDSSSRIWSNALTSLGYPDDYLLNSRRNFMNNALSTDWSYVSSYGCAPNSGQCYKVKELRNSEEGISTQMAHSHFLEGLENAVITPTKRTDVVNYEQNKVNYNPPYYALAFIMKI